MEVVRNIVAQPVDEYVVGVEVSSRPVILPKVENGTVSPPTIPCCSDRHIIRTPDSVVVVEVSARVTVFSRTIPLADVREAIRSESDIILQEEGRLPGSESYAEGLGALTGRLVKQLQDQGITVEN